MQQYERILDDLQDHRKNYPMVHSRRGFSRCKVIVDGDELDHEKYPIIDTPYKLFDQFVEADVMRNRGMGDIRLVCDGNVVEMHKKYPSERMHRWI